MKNDITFVLLAGGKSKRMTFDKGLLKFNNNFWILEQLNRISKANISRVYIGLGYNFENYFDEIPLFENAQNSFVEFKNLQIKTIVNNSPEKGSFSTLQTVLKNISKKNDIVICPIDTPILNPEELNKIIAEKNTVVIPNYKNKNGHPIKLSYSFSQKLCNLDVLDEFSRLDYQIKRQKSGEISIIKVFDSSVVLNLNSIEDWKEFICS